MSRPSKPRAATSGLRPTVRPALLVAILATSAIITIIAVRTSGGGRGGAPEAKARVGSDLHSLVVLADGRLYVGGHDGAAVSRDGARTWTAMPGLAGSDAMGWAVRTGDLLVAGHPGVTRSTDGGRTFDVRRTTPDTDVHALGGGPTTLYAAGPRFGLATSTDGGDTWTLCTGSQGQRFFGQILVDASDEQHAVAADTRTGPAETTDGGRSWRTLGGPPAAWLSSTDAGLRTLYASGTESTARSDDGGRTWSDVRIPDGAALLAATPDAPQHLFAAGLDGDVARLWESEDGARTWTAR